MKNRMKKVAALLLSTMLAAGLMVGCGSKKDSGDLTGAISDANKAVNELQESGSEKKADEEMTKGDEKAETTEVGSGISDEAKEALKNVTSDYNKVNWGVAYSPDDMEGIVISVAPFAGPYNTDLIVGVTNLYDQDVSFYAEGTALDADGKETGSLVIYESALCPGNTAISWCYCDGTPDGRINWTKIELEEPYGESAAWDADWSLGGTTDRMEITSTMKNSSDKTMELDEVMFLVLDENGDIVAWSQDYFTDKIEAGASIDIKETLSEISKSAGTPADVAMFANPTIATE